MQTIRTIISLILLLALGLFAQAINPSVGVNKYGSTGLFSIPVPQTIRAGHLAIGLKNHLNTPVLNLSNPAHMTIGISDRTEFYASTNGYGVEAEKSIIDKGLGIKVNLRQSRSFPLSIFVQQNTRENYDVIQDTIFTDSQQLSLGMLTNQRLLGAQIYSKVGVIQTTLTGVEDAEYAIDLGLGVSKTLYKEIQLIADINSAINQDRTPWLQAAIGARLYLMRNIQIGFNSSWVSDDHGLSQQFSAMLTVSTQKFKTFNNPRARGLSGSLTNILEALGLLKSPQIEDAQFPEYFVSRQDRKLPKPPPITQFKAETALVPRPEYQPADNQKLPRPPSLQSMMDMEEE